MAATIRDIARMARVSVATVSRALNGHGNVAPLARERVLAAARDLHYVPHQAARSLINRRTNVIGVVLPDLHGEFFSELIRGIDQAARDSGKQLLLSGYHGDRDEQEHALGAMRGRVDGLLLMAPGLSRSGNATTSNESGGLELPLVLIDTPAAEYSTERCVSVDHYGGAIAMTRHLLEQGHRKIAFLPGPCENFHASERLRGYLDALAQHPSKPDAWLLAEGDFSQASGQCIGRELSVASSHPDAVFAANDTMALGCLFALQQGGLDVPHDIAVAGFDDIPMAAYTHPALTTIRVDIAELGARALRLLLDETRTTNPVAISPELIVRESCASVFKKRRRDSS